MEMTQAELDAELIRRFPLCFFEMLEPQDRFIRIKTGKGRTPKRRIFEAGNKAGKTEIGCAEDIAHCFGFRPWLDEDDPDYKIDIKVPNVGLICGETIAHSISEKIEPTLRRLIPSICNPQWKSGPTGVLMRIDLPFNSLGKKCGSRIFIRSYDQRPDTFEGIDYDWIHFDEPPPIKHLNAIERGKVVSNAPSWFTMTPLKEPHIFDRFSSRAAHRC